MEIDKEDLKNETKETVNQVKDTLKNVDINKEAKETKGFLKEMLVNPFEKITNIAEGNEDAFKKAVVLVIINMAVVLISALISTFRYSYGTFGNKIWNLVMQVLTPLIAVVIPSIVILLMNKSNKKSLTTILSTVVVARIPIIISNTIGILTSLFARIILITSPIATMLSAISIVLTYTGMRTLFGEEKESFLMKFAVIEFITALVIYIV